MPTEKQNDRFEDKNMDDNKKKTGTDTDRSGRQGERDAERQNQGGQGNVNQPGQQRPNQDAYKK